MRASADLESDPAGWPDEPLDKAVWPLRATEDSVQIYLAEIGRVRLLTAGEEVELAKAIEAGGAVDALRRLTGVYEAAPAFLRRLDEVFPMALAKLRSEEEGVARELWAALSEDSASVAPPCCGTQAYAEARQRLAERLCRSEQARQRLIEANLRLVVSIVKRYAGRGVSFADLVQEGNLGLLRAVEKFDHRRGFRFSTYASWWIRRAVLRAFSRNETAAGIPLRGTTDLLLPLSLDSPAGEDGNLALGDLVEDRAAVRPYEAVEQAHLRGDVAAVLATLSTRERHVLRLRFGFTSSGRHTVDEAGRRIGVSSARIRQIESRALLKLHHPARSSRLRDYVTW